MIFLMRSGGRIREPPFSSFILAVFPLRRILLSNEIRILRSSPSLVVGWFYV
jgi:hypothetical protein